MIDEWRSSKLAMAHRNWPPQLSEGRKATDGQVDIWCVFGIMSCEGASQELRLDISIDRSLNRRPTTVDVKTGTLGNMGGIGNWAAQPSMTVRNACVSMDQE